MLRRLLFVGAVAAGFVALGSAAHASSSGSCNLSNLHSRACTSAAAPAASVRAARAAPAAAAPAAEPVRSGPKRIDISLGEQRLRAFEGDTVVLDTPVSTGAAGWETPTGHFAIHSKEDMHWSRAFDVWMPKAMQVVGGIFIHQLPLTPGGAVIGAGSLGRAVSHGCIRLSPQAAGFLFNWAQIGTPVTIH